MFTKVVQVVPMPDFSVYVYFEDGKIVLVCGIFVDINALNPQPFQCIRKQVDGATVNFCRADKAVASVADIEQGEQYCRLSGGGSHGADPALQLCDFILNRHNSRISKPGVDQRFHRVVEYRRHFFCGIVNIGCTLHDGQHFWFCVPRRVACVQTLCLISHKLFLRIFLLRRRNISWWYLQFPALLQTGAYRQLLRCPQ